MFKPNREFQAGLNAREARRAREKNSLSLRRKDREIKLQNKRKKILKQSTQTPFNNNTNNNNNRNHNGNTLNNDQISQQKLLSQLKRYVEGCFSDHKATQFECTQKIRKLLSFSHNVPIQQVIDSGVIPRLIQFLHKKEMPQLQFETMWALTNIASSDNPEHTAKIVRDGALQPFMNILKIKNYPLQEQAIWGIGNIAGDCLELRNMLLQNGVLSYLKECCNTEFNENYYAIYGEDVNQNNQSQQQNPKQTPEEQYISLFRNLSWAISNFCRGGGHKNNELKGLLECLYYLLQNQDIIIHDDNNGDDSEAIGVNIGWSFCYLTNDIDDFENTKTGMMDIMNNYNITKNLIKLLNSNNIYAIHSTLRAIGNILTGSDKNTQKCIEYGVLSVLYKLLKRFYCEDPNDGKLREICWAISNITAGPIQQIVAVIEANFIPMLIEILKGSRDHVATEALWAISNATACCDDQIISYLVDQGIIQGLCKYFEYKFYGQQYNKRMNKKILVTLECMENILISDDKITCKYATEFEEYGGTKFLEYLQSDDNIDELLYEKAVTLIKEYFDGQSDDDEYGINNNNNNANDVDLSCANNGSQFAFGLNTNNKNNDNNGNGNNASNGFSF